MAKKPIPRSKKRVLKAARFRVLPLTLAMLSLLLVAKLNDIYINSRQLGELLNVRESKAAEGDKPADATAATDAKPADAVTAPAADAKSADTLAVDTAKDDKKDASGAKPPAVPRTYGAGKLTVEQVEELKARENKQPYSQTELDLLQNLSQRRDELDQRAKDLDMKSTVLDATEKRIDDKIADMKQLQAQLSKVVAQYQQQEDTQIKSLVKIYESMKPGDAANIFNELDMPILLEVIDKMSERKVAPVLAGMDPKRAREVTQELAEMRKGQQSMANSAAAATK